MNQAEFGRLKKYSQITFEQGLTLGIALSLWGVFALFNFYINRLVVTSIMNYGGSVSESHIRLGELLLQLEEYALYGAIIFTIFFAYNSYRKNGLDAWNVR